MIAKIALGTWLMGGTKDRNPNNDDAHDKSVIHCALENGITLIDTAQNYANGRCEELIGEALKDLPRDSYQLLTKQRREQLSYQDVLRGCDESLRRLNVDYLDYFVCHAPNPDFEMTDFFKATNQLYRMGKIRNVGVSNFGPNLLKLAAQGSDLPIALNQVQFSLFDDDVLDTGTYAFCVQNNIPIQAYRTLTALEENHSAYDQLEIIAKRHLLSTQQIALAYLNSYQNIVFTIRASTDKHWDEVKAALNILLSDEEVSLLRATHQGISGPQRDFLIQ